METHHQQEECQQGDDDARGHDEEGNLLDHGNSLHRVGGGAVILVAMVFDVLEDRLGVRTLRLDDEAVRLLGLAVAVFQLGRGEEAVRHEDGVETVGEADDAGAVVMVLRLGNVAAAQTEGLELDEGFVELGRTAAGGETEIIHRQVGAREDDRHVEGRIPDHGLVAGVDVGLPGVQVEVEERIRDGLDEHGRRHGNAEVGEVGVDLERAGPEHADGIGAREGFQVVDLLLRKVVRSAQLDLAVGNDDILVGDDAVGVLEEGIDVAEGSRSEEDDHDAHDVRQHETDELDRVGLGQKEFVNESHRRTIRL